MRKCLLVFGFMILTIPCGEAVQPSSVTVRSLPVAKAPSLIRREGKVNAHDRQNYRLKFQEITGTTETLHYNNHMHAYLRGHAIPWIDVKPGDSLIILETDEPLETAAGSRMSEESSGSVEAVNRSRLTFQLRNSQGRLEEFIDTPAVRIYRHGTQVIYLDTNPGDSVTVRY